MTLASADEALAKLKVGNARFVAGDRCLDTFRSQTDLQSHVSGQSPFAIVLGCSDSRVPVEIVFDVGLGELFVVRVAGNVVAPTLIASIEFAVQKFATRLIVVLGHSGCGAVDATLAAVENNADGHPGQLNAIVERIQPAAVNAQQVGGSREDILEAAVRENVRTSAARLRSESEVLGQLIDTGGLLVVGAEYSLKTGAVDFFDGAPAGT